MDNKERFWSGNTLSFLQKQESRVTKEAGFLIPKIRDTKEEV